MKLLATTSISSLLFFPPATSCKSRGNLWAEERNEHAEQERGWGGGLTRNKQDEKTIIGGMQAILKISLSLLGIRFGYNVSCLQEDDNIERKQYLNNVAD